MFRPIYRPIARAIASALTQSLPGGFNPASLFTDGSKGVVYDNNDFVDSATWRRNLLTYSEQFDNAIWPKSDATIVANATTAPDGTTTADLIYPTTTGSNRRILRDTNTLTTNGATYTQSVYVKAAGKNWVFLNGVDATSAANNCWFDLQNGIVGTKGASVVSASITSVGGGWYRIATVGVAAANDYFYIMGVDADNSLVATTNSTDGIYIWGAQLDLASSASDYQRITDFNTEFLAAFPSTTLFLDSAGTTPATVNGLVGLQLDKSANLALGADTVTNGDFSSATGWAISAPSETSISGGKLTFTLAPNGANVQTTLTSAPVVGRFYKITLAIDSITLGTVRIQFAGGVVQFLTAGIKTAYVLASSTSSTLVVQAWDAVNNTSVVDLVSVQELPGNHRYQTTTGSKPVLRGTPIGSNLVTNGDFASGTGWTTGAGWAIGSGVATATTSTGTLTHTLAATASKVYRLTYTLVTRTAGSIQPSFGGALGASRSAAGTYVEYLTTTTTAVLSFASTTLSGSIDNVEVVDVSAGSVTAPYGLQYDGVDDFLQTASVDFTATDKMFVCAGVRKLSDAALGCIAELSINSGSNSGTFRVLAGNGATGGAPRYDYLSRGTASAAALSPDSYPAPNTSVYAGISDIGQDICILRLNGAQADSKTTDQGTGNYGSYAIYFGRRAGTSIPYNGLDFGMVICGKTLTSNQISSTERYIAQRTGVTI